MKQLTFGKNTVVDEAEKVPEEIVAEVAKLNVIDMAVCSCGCAQFRLYKSSDVNYIVCPTCGAVYSLQGV